MMLRNSLSQPTKTKSHAHNDWKNTETRPNSKLRWHIHSLGGTWSNMGSQQHFTFAIHFGLWWEWEIQAKEARWRMKAKKPSTKWRNAKQCIACALHSMIIVFSTRSQYALVDRLLWLMLDIVFWLYGENSAGSNMVFVCASQRERGEGECAREFI